MLQGGGFSYDFDVFKTLKNAYNQVEILDDLTVLTEENDFKILYLIKFEKIRLRK